MEIIDKKTWKRELHYEHFKSLKDPFFGVTIGVEVTNAYNSCKANSNGFFGRYLHDCMKAINDIDELKMRVIKDEIVKYDVINASATILRKDKTFGFSYIDFDLDPKVFYENIEDEKQRIEKSIDLFPPKNGLDCIHCSTLPWLNFSGHKEPVSGVFDTIPKLAFSKINFNEKIITMNVAINVNHALVDGYHLSLFVDKFQHYLNEL